MVVDEVSLQGKLRMRRYGLWGEGRGFVGCVKSWRAVAVTLSQSAG